LINEDVKYIGIILSSNLMDLVVFQYLYGGFDAWPINTEFLGDDRAIFRVGVYNWIDISWGWKSDSSPKHWNLLLLEAPSALTNVLAYSLQSMLFFIFYF
jgi:hypothetical protein